MKERRFIEEFFPVKEISAESANEKYSRYENIATLHTWWARKPHSASRTTEYSSLIPSVKTKKELEIKRTFITKLGKSSKGINYSALNEARLEILKKNNGVAPKILDPFAGGGTIPFESLSLGCETFASDYNPVSIIILKCGIEYPQKYGHSSYFKKELAQATTSNKLFNDLKKWNNWVFKQAQEELREFFPTINDYTDIAYLWARTIPCQNPKCGIEIPLIGQYWLQQAKNHNISLYPEISGEEINFKIIGPGYDAFPSNFDPNNGTISNAIVSCLVCGFIIDSNTTRRIFRDDKSNQKLIAVISQKKGTSGKKFRISSETDIRNFKKAETFLRKKVDLLFKKWGLNPIPDEIIHVPLMKKYQFGDPLYNYNPIVLYGITTWGDLFNSRQKLALIIFIEKVRDAFDEMIKSGYDVDYAKAILSFLALSISRIADFNSKLCILNTHGSPRIAHTFGSVSLHMMWFYSESNPLSPFGSSWKTTCQKNEKWVQFASNLSNTPATVTQNSATSLSYPDNYFDAIFTDPPYYDMVPYSMLSDFFYVWLKRSLVHVFPEFFSTPLTPKSNEVINEVPMLRRIDKDQAHKLIKTIHTSDSFEKNLFESFKEMYRVLKQDGIAIIIYAYRTTSGWEKMIKSLLNSGLVVTASWPINTEMKKRLRAQDSATISSSIYMIARKSEKEPIGFYKEVKNELKKYLDNKLTLLWNEGIVGADFFISAIGSAIEVFGKYEKVVDDADNIITVKKLLNDIRDVVTNYAIKQIIHSEFSDEISQMTRFYILWRWAYGEAKVPFDDARKMAQSTGIDLEHEWNKGFIIKDKEFIRVISPAYRKEENLEESHELIDVLHLILLLWKKNKKEELEKLLQEKGYDKSDMFKRIAQAISESLPMESIEKKWLDGFLTGFRIDYSQSGVQTKLI